MFYMTLLTETGSEGHFRFRRCRRRKKKKKTLAVPGSIQLHTPLHSSSFLAFTFHLPLQKNPIRSDPIR